MTTNLSQVIAAASQKHQATSAKVREKSDIWFALCETRNRTLEERNEAANKHDEALEAFFIARRRRRQLNSAIEAFDAEFEKTRNHLREVQWNLLEASNRGDVATIESQGADYAATLAAFDEMFGGERGKKYAQDTADHEQANREFEAAQQAKDAATETLDRLDKAFKEADRLADKAYAELKAADEELTACARDVATQVFDQFTTPEQQALRRKCQESEDANWMKYYP